MTWDSAVSVNVWVLLALTIMAIIGGAGGLWVFIDHLFRDFLVEGSV